MYRLQQWRSIVRGAIGGRLRILILQLDRIGIGLLDRGHELGRKGVVAGGEQIIRFLGHSGMEK